MNNSRAHFGNNQQCFFEVSDPLHSVQHFYLTCFAEHGDILLLRYFGLCCVLGCAMCIHYNSTILYSLQWGANAIIPNILCLKLCDLSFEASYCFSFGRMQRWGAGAVFPIRSLHNRHFAMEPSITNLHCWSNIDPENLQTLISLSLLQALTVPRGKCAPLCQTAAIPW